MKTLTFISIGVFICISIVYLSINDGNGEYKYDHNSALIVNRYGWEYIETLGDLNGPYKYDGGFQGNVNAKIKVTTHSLGGSSVKEYDAIKNCEIMVNSFKNKIGNTMAMVYKRDISKIHQ